MTGSFYTPLDFKAFRFDNQLLVVQVQVAARWNWSTIVIHPATTGKELYQPKVIARGGGGQPVDSTIHAPPLTARSPPCLLRRLATTSAAGNCNLWTSIRTSMTRLR